MNVLGRGNHSLLSLLMLATLRPSIAVELLVNSPFNVLIVSEIFCQLVQYECILAAAIQKSISVNLFAGTC